MPTDDELQRQLDDLRSDDPVRQDRVLRPLYESRIVQGEVKKMIRQYTGNKLQVADVIQDGVFKLFVSVRNGAFKENSSLRTFLIGICKNDLRNAGRHSRNRLTDSLDAPAYEDRPVAGAEDSTDLEQWEHHERIRQRNALIQSLLDRLTVDCRKALGLFYWEKKSNQEIAEVFSLANQEGAKKKTHRCRGKLRDLIEKDPVIREFLKTNR